jgi:hypothetical protein
MKYIIFIAIIIVVACKPTASRNQSIRNDTIDSTIIKSSVSRVFQEKDINTAEINGIWAKNEDDNAVFWVENDSLYPLEHPDRPAKLEFKGDTLYTYYDGLTTKDIIIKLNSDSLVLLNEFDKIIKLYKRK